LKHQEASAGVTDAGTPPATGGDAATPDRSQPAQWSDGRSRAPAVANPTHDAGIRLSADGATIRPATASQGVYTFVVPSGRARVRLESHFGTSVDPRTPDPRT